MRQTMGMANAQVVAETIQPRRSGSMILVAFVALDGTGAAVTHDDYEQAVRQATAGVTDQLAASLPAYMVPMAYIPVPTVPMTATGKVDRRQLRALGSSLTADDIAALSRSGGGRRTPESDTERLMQALWAEVLKTDADVIGTDDSFFRIGGDFHRSDATRRAVAPEGALVHGPRRLPESCSRRPRRALCRRLGGETYLGLCCCEWHAALRHRE